MRILELEQIKTILAGLDLIPAIEEGFVCYSNGQTNVPPVGELQLEKGAVHIKYGAIESQPFYVIKISSGFYGNPDLGLSSSNGCMLLFSQETGQMECLLLDEGHLTDVRTAVAGAIAAKHLAPKAVSRVGIVGTGIQARAQLRYLASVVDCRDVLVWGRSQTKLDDYVQDFASDLDLDSPFQIDTTLDVSDILKNCNLVVTTTPAVGPLLRAEHLKAGTHITAVGSDTAEKQELESEILASADIVIADSVQQCLLRGEISHALPHGHIDGTDVIELGNIISGEAPGRVDDRQVTIADLTGVAVQDIQIASAVLEAALAPV